MSQFESEISVTGLDPIPVLRAFAGLVRAIGLYPSGHPSIEQAAAELSSVTQPMLEAVGRLDIDIIDGDVHLSGHPFRKQSRTVQREIDLLADMGIHSLRLDPGVCAEELLSLATRLHRTHSPDLAEADQDAGTELSAESHVQTYGLVFVDRVRELREWPDRPDTIWDPHYGEALERAGEAFESFATGGQPGAGALQDLLGVLTDQVANSSVALSQILALKNYESHTYTHSVNVSVLSLLIAGRIGLDEKDTAQVAEAALLHDIGKTRMPMSILTKPGPLDPSEWRMIRHHPRMGAEVLLAMPGLSPLTPTVALEHHMDYLGGGYPEIGPDHKPHALSQLVAVADIYESLTGARSYRDPAPPEQACLVLARLAGQKLNPALVRTFISAVSFFPLGTLVRTTLDEIGLVVQTTDEDPLHPTIRPTRKGKLSPETPLIDTAERNSEGAYLRHVVETLRPDALSIDLDECFAA